MIESVLLAVTRIATLFGLRPLSTATGFFFQREEHLFLITSRHVVLDEESGHRPDGLTIELHTDPQNVATTTQFFMPLYGDQHSLWREGRDSAGIVDVVAVEIQRAALPATLLMCPFTPAHLVAHLDAIEVGARVSIVGFPLTFHDLLHHLPVARQAMIASAFGLRFQGHGYFLTDARLHRGMSGAPAGLTH